jgi:hypothetical protein
MNAAFFYSSRIIELTNARHLDRGSATTTARHLDRTLSEVEWGSGETPVFRLLLPQNLLSSCAVFVATLHLFLLSSFAEPGSPARAFFSLG